MRILSRHFLSSYIGFYCAILLASNLIIIVVELMLNFDDMLEYREGLWGAATYLFLRMPSYYLPYMIPLASFGAAFLCLGLPARAQELMAIKAGGISPHRIALPILTAAATVSGIALLVNETIVLGATREFNRIDASGGEQDLFQTGGSFWYHRGAFLYNVESAERASRTLRGVSVYQRNAEGQLVRSIEAESALIAPDDRWRLRNATIRLFDPDDTAAAPRTERVAESVLAVGDRGDLALLDADAGTLPLLRLRAYIEALDGAGRSTTRYRALYQARLAEPLSALLFALLAIPIGLAVERSRSLAVAALQGIATVGAFYAVSTTAALIAASGIAVAVASPWLLLALFGGYGAWRFARIPA